MLEPLTLEPTSVNSTLLSLQLSLQRIWAASPGFFLLFLFALSLSATRAMIFIAKKSGLIDVPNHRSSHTLPTPRGGGVGFALIMCALGSFLIGPTFVGACGLAVLILGVLDDKFSLPAKFRLAFQVLFSLGAVVLCAKNFPIAPTLWWPLIIIASLGVAWTINLTNFMDGLDGIATSHALIFFIASAWIFKNDPALLMLMSGFSAVLTGFLVWNWSPAKIFMGDGGSGTLGFWIGITLVIAATSIGWAEFFALICAYNFFISDTAFTLIRRARRGAPLTHPHREHFYQQWAQAGLRHDQVVITSLGLTLGIGFPGFVACLIFPSFSAVVSALSLMITGILSAHYRPVT